MASARPATSEPSTAIVLAGGGALGAYEAGALSYVLDTLPRQRHLRRPPRFQLYCGTSVGALNACYLAASARAPAKAAAALADFWRSLTFDEVLAFGTNELGAVLRVVLGGRTVPTVARTGRNRLRAVPHEPVAGLFDTGPLRRLTGSLVPWRELGPNIAEGHVGGVAVCATEICTGLGVIFYDTSPQTTYRPGRDPTKIARRVKLGAEHAMASAAMPFLFPSVQVDGVCYTDGALRQNTPLNPALRMGADRVLVVSVSQPPDVSSCMARIGCRQNPFPGGLFLLGKTVGILLSQSLDYELERVKTYNRLLAGGSEAYGDGFPAQLNAILGPHRNATYRPVRTCHLRPTQSIHRLALDALNGAPSELLVPGLPGRVLSRFLRSAVFTESDLLATVMFTPTFLRSLVELGYRDAESRRDELEAFFG